MQNGLRHRLIIGAALACASIALAGNAFAKDYTANLAQAVQNYADKGEFKGVTINIACRRLPAMEFLMNHRALFEEYTGANIQVTNYPEKSLRSKIVSDASTQAGGFAIYCLDNNYIPLFAANDWVHSLTGHIQPEYNLDDIFDSLLQSYKWHGKLYGLPIYSEVTILYYRKDLFKKHGVEVPDTLAELTAAAKKLNNPPRTFGIALRGLRGEGMNVYIWTEFLRSYGGNFLSSKMKPVFNSKAGIKATRHYKQLIRKYGPPGVGTWGWPQVESAFAAGRVAMIIESTAFYPIFEDPKQSSVAGKVGYAVVPAGPKGRYPANYSIGLAVAATVPKDSEKFEAAVAFVQWGTSKPMAMARVADGIGNVNRKSVASSELMAKNIGSDYRKAVRKSREITKPNYRPRMPHWRMMGNIIGLYLEKAFTGQMTVPDALNTAAAKIKKRFKELGVLGTDRPYPEMFEPSK